MINMAFSFQNAEEVIVTCSGRIRYEIVRLTCSQLDLLLQREKKPLCSAAQLLHRAAGWLRPAELDQH